MSEKNIGFRTTKEQADRLESLAEQLEMSVSDLVRRALNHGITPAIQEIAAEKKEGMKKALKMVRGTGIEPVTPTVSRWEPAFA